MKTYTVEQIANATGKSPETIRRLVRNKKIKAPQKNSSKEGFLISEEALKDFFDEFPRYFTPAASLLLSSSLPMAMPAILVGVAASAINKNKQMTEKDVKYFVDKKIKENTKIVESRKESIKKLKKEMKRLQSEMEKAQDNLSMYQRAINELNFKELADEVNVNLYGKEEL